MGICFNDRQLDTRYQVAVLMRGWLFTATLANLGRILQLPPDQMLRIDSETIANDQKVVELTPTHFHPPDWANGINKFHIKRDRPKPTG